MRNTAADIEITRRFIASVPALAEKGYNDDGDGFFSCEGPSHDKRAMNACIKLVHPTYRKQPGDSRPNYYCEFEGVVMMFQYDGRYYSQVRVLCDVTEKYHPLS